MNLAVVTEGRPLKEVVSSEGSNLRLSDKLVTQHKEEASERSQRYLSEREKTADTNKYLWKG